MIKKLIAIIFFILGNSSFAETKDFDLKLYVFLDNSEQRGAGAGLSFEGFVLNKDTMVEVESVFIQSFKSAIQYLPKSYDLDPIFMLSALNFSFMGGTYENSNDHIVGLLGTSINLFDIVSYSNEYKRFGIGDFEINVGCLYESENGDLIILGSTGVAAEAVSIHIKKASKSFKKRNQNITSAKEALGGFLVKFNANLKIQFRKIITLDQNYGIEISPLYLYSDSDSDLESIRTYQLETSLNPFKSILDSYILKSFHIGLDHRHDTIKLKGHQIRTKFLGASAGFQF